MTDPVEDIPTGVASLMKVHFKEIHRKYLPWISSIPLEKGMRWEPTWKATPNDDRAYVGRGFPLNPKASGLTPLV